MVVSNGRTTHVETFTGERTKSQVALAIVRYIRDSKTSVVVVLTMIRSPVDACNTLFKTVCGMTSNPCMVLYRVCLGELTDELLGQNAARNNYMRAFFHFSLRRGGDTSKWKDMCGENQAI
jgi:hypothetical protein